MLTEHILRRLAVGKSCYEKKVATFYPVDTLRVSKAFS